MKLWEVISVLYILIPILVCPLCKSEVACFSVNEIPHTVCSHLLSRIDQCLWRFSAVILCVLFLYVAMTTAIVVADDGVTNCVVKSNVLVCT